MKVIIILLVMAGVGYAAYRQQAANIVDPWSEQGLANAVADANKSFPQFLGRNIRFDRVELQPGRHILYRIAVTSRPTAYLVRSEELKRVKDEVVAGGCRQFGIGTMLAHEVQVSFSFYAMDGAQLGQLAFSKGDCVS